MASEYEFASLRGELAATQLSLGSLESEVAQLRHALATLPTEIGDAVAQALRDATPTLTAAELPPPSAMPTTDDDGLEF